MSVKEYLRSQKGLTPTGSITFIIVVTLLFMLALTVGKPFMNSLLFDGEIKEVTKHHIKRNDAIFKKSLRKRARDRSFYIEDGDILIKRDFDLTSLEVTVIYTYDLSLPFYEKTLVFETTTIQELDSGPAKTVSSSTKAKQKKAEGAWNKIKRIFDL